MASIQQYYNNAGQGSNASLQGGVTITANGNTERDFQVATEVKRLHDQSRTINDLLETLMARITPVLHPEPTGVSKMIAPVEDTRCQLAIDLASVTVRMDEGVSMLRQMLDRLEL